MPEQPQALDLPVAGSEASWLDAFELRAFADAYISANFAFPKPQTGPNQVIRAYDITNGFALAWVGADVAYPAEPVGGTVSLRFGPSATRYADSCLSDNTRCDSEVGLEFVKQAFASFRPGKGSAWLFEVGKFDTIYGAEVAESQDNLNYTRGALYWLGQPLFHTGLRVSWEAARFLTLKGLLVNGWNNTLDNNVGKSFGLQTTFHVPKAASPADDLLSVSLGYMIGPEQDDVVDTVCDEDESFDPALGCVTDPGASGGVFPTDLGSSNSEGLRHFLDLVLLAQPLDALTLVLNADFGFENRRSADSASRFDPMQWWGGMLAARYALSERFALAVRGEYYRDDDGLTTGIAELDIVTGTLTFEERVAENLIILLDGRLDWANKQIFQEGLRGTTGTMATATLGLVITSN